MNGRAVLAWVAGLPLTLLGLLLLVGAPPAGIVVTLVGLYVLPPVNRRVDIDIAPSWAAAWVAGAFLFFFALVIAHLVPIAAAVAVVGGLFALPPVRRQVTGRTRLELRRWAVVGVVLLAAVGASATAALALETDETLGHETIVHDTGERFTVDGGDTDIALTVEAVNRTYSLEDPGQEWIRPPDEAYLVLTLRIENVGDDHVSFQAGTFAAVSADDEVSAPMDVDTNSIRGGAPYQAPGLDLSPSSSGPTLDAGESVTRTVAFQVESGRTYLFTVPTTASYSGADRHYVTLGEV